MNDRRIVYVTRPEAQCGCTMFSSLSMHNVMRWPDERGRGRRDLIRTMSAVPAWSPPDEPKAQDYFAESGRPMRVPLIALNLSYDVYVYPSTPKCIYRGFCSACGTEYRYGDELDFIRMREMGYL